jgi:hypothetical protein
MCYSMAYTFSFRIFKSKPWGNFKPTLWCIVLQNLRVVQLITQFANVNEIEGFNAVFIQTHRWSLS